MNESRKGFGCVGITVVFWLLSRALPIIIGSVAPNAILFRCSVMLIMLPIGFAVVKDMSKGKHSGCIRVNLYIFAFLEGTGAFEALSYVTASLSHSTGRYSHDIYGMAYSDYALYYGGLLLFEIIYVIFCVCLAKKTESQSPEESTKAPIEPSIEEMTLTKRSSTIEAVLHKDEYLYIKLRSGDFYLYKNLPRKVYVRMMNAPSMGDYYRKHIRGRYVETKL